MLFWKSLWKNDHAITYLSEKHLAMAPRRAWNSLPERIKVVLPWSVCGLAVLSLLAVLKMVAEEGWGGLLSAGVAGLMLGLYGSLFWGGYRAWTLGSLLSKLRQSEALPTFLYTAVRVEDAVDVLAARTFRQIIAFVMFPFGSLCFAMMAFLPFRGLSQVPWELLIFLTPMLSYFALLGAFALTVVHAAVGDSGPKAIGKGLLLLFLSFYTPSLIGGIFAGVIPAAEGIVGTLVVIYYLSLPLLLRKCAIHWLKAEPSYPKKGRVAGLIAGATSCLPRVSGAFLFKSLAERNPVLARTLSSQNLLLPIAVALGIHFLSTHMLSPFASDLHQTQQQSWISVHIVTWITAGGLALVTFANSQASVFREERSGALEILRTTPLSPRSVIDAWAMGALWAYVLIASGLLIWQLPGCWQALAFALSLPICAAYGGIVCGLKDSIGTWVWSGVAGVMFLSWVGLPAVFVSGVVHAHLGLAVLVLGAAWYLRRRALLVYGA